MGAKSIVERYMERNRSILPKGKEELRQHIADVASEAKLSLSSKELDELAPLPLKRKAERGQNKKETESAASDTSKDDLNEIESN